MGDLIHLMDSLVDVKGKILVPGIYDTVRKLTDEEKATYEPIEFDPVCVLLFIYLVIYGTPAIFHQ
jgi:hypothetical protein